MMRHRFFIALSSMLLALPMAARAELAVQQVDVRIPVAVPAAGASPAHTAELAGHIYRPQAVGPWGLVVLSHGTPGGQEAREALTDRYTAQARAIAALGYVVITGLRRGYGASDGPLADRYGSCDAPDYAHAAQESARDVAAIMSWGQKLPYVDSANVVLLGKSAGGFASLALAAQQPAGLRGVINFAGGRGAQPQMREKQTVCNEAALLDTIAGFAPGTRVPMLWVYAENDSYFRPALVQKMAQRYQKSSPNLNLTLLMVKPADASRHEGHGYFDRAENIAFWLPDVRNFLMKQVPGTAQALLKP